jgi:hypothetical protein
MSDKRQMNQLVLALTEGGVKLRGLLRKGPNRARRNAKPNVQLVS